jgi:hypothetical protein
VFRLNLQRIEELCHQYIPWSLQTLQWPWNYLYKLIKNYKHFLKIQFWKIWLWK